MKEHDERKRNRRCPSLRGGFTPDVAPMPPIRKRKINTSWLGSTANVDDRWKRRGGGEVKEIAISLH